MKLDVLNTQGQKTGRVVELPDSVFAIEPNEHAIYLDVKAYLANQRQGTHKAKERSEVSRSTRKLFRQKGTGGARRGDMKSPIVKGGGRVFGPKPRDYSQKLNKKVKILARKSALSTKAKEAQVVVVEDFTFDAPKTKAFLAVMTGLNLEGKKSLFVTAAYDKNVYLSARNLDRMNVLQAGDLNTYAIMNSGALLLSESSVAKIVETLN